MKFILLFSLLWLAPALPAAPNPGMALGDNEVLIYHVSWAVLPGVGSIEISAKGSAGPEGQPLLHVVSTTSTRGLARLLLPFEATSESLFDMNSARLISIHETSEKRSQHAAHTVTFDYPGRTATYVSTEPEAETRQIPMPPGYPTDLITCLVQARTWNLKPGETHDALVLFEDEFYELTIHALGYESVTTPLGTFTALVLEPRMDKTPPKGMFKRGSTARVWISQDGRRLPVRFKVDFKFGSGAATLAEYHPPGPIAK